MSSEYVLFAGPYPPPVHGQSFAFKMAYDHFRNNKILLSQNLEVSSNTLRVLMTIKTLFRYIYLFSRYKIRVVYIAGSRSMLGAFKDIVLINLSRWNGARVINHVHAAYFNLFLQRLPVFVRNIYQRAYKKVNVFICLLPQMKEEYTDFQQTASIEVVGNFYDPAMDLLEDHDLAPCAEPVICYFSNLIYSKGIFDVVDAFLICKKKFPALKLKVAGNYGSDAWMNASEVRSRFENVLSEQPDVQYLGPVYHHAKTNFLRSAEIFVLPSFYSSEAFPISILEAMRQGNAIIVSDHHYLAGVVNVETGKVVPPRNPEALAEAINNWLSQPEELLKIRKCCREFAKSRFELRQYNEHLYTIIHREMSR
ncbi:MAG: glycosyltransferase family 4 protein [Saprospiraceae bacterium]